MKKIIYIIVYANIRILFYKNIEGIRYLEVSHYMQKMANINNIDWNEYWPELESITPLEY